MSNILDAIRKAEAERMDDAVPSLEAMVQKTRAGDGRKNQKRIGWLIWIALVVVTASAAYLYKDTLLDHGGVFKQRVVGKSKALLAKVGADSLTGRRYSVQAILPRNAAPARTVSGVDANATGVTERQRQLLDTLRFDVVSYSRDNLKRFAMIGSRTYREGEQLEGFAIRRISAEGVLLDVGGNAILVRP